MPPPPPPPHGRPWNHGRAGQQGSTGHLAHSMPHQAPPWRREAAAFEIAPNADPPSLPPSLADQAAAGLCTVRPAPPERVRRTTVRVRWLARKPKERRAPSSLPLWNSCLRSCVCATQVLPRRAAAAPRFPPALFRHRARQAQALDTPSSLLCGRSAAVAGRCGKERRQADKEGGCLR